MRQWWLGRPVPMAGVSSVTVAPEYRGRGIGRMLMTALLDEIAAQGYHLSALFPATMPLYRSLGWELAGARDTVVIPARSLLRLVPPDAQPPEAGTVPATGLRRAGSGDAEAVVAVTGSDNIYVDFLLGSGIEGLAFLLLCFGTCWRLTTTLSVTSATIVYRSAVVFTLSAGLATIAPASTFVAPFFFALVGVAAIPRESPHDPTSPR